MPFKSKAQQRFMFAAEERGDLPKGTAERWAKHTKSIKKLPEKKTEKNAFAPASPEDVDLFIKSAMGRYADLGVPAERAERLLAAKLADVAGALGFRAETPAETVVKHAAESLMARGVPEKEARVLLTHYLLKKAHGERLGALKRTLVSSFKWVE